jgi:hypothetical protein
MSEQDKINIGNSIAGSAVIAGDDNKVEVHHHHYPQPVPPPQYPTPDTVKAFKNEIYP